MAFLATKPSQTTLSVGIPRAVSHIQVLISRPAMAVTANKARPAAQLPMSARAPNQPIAFRPLKISEPAQITAAEGSVISNAKNKIGFTVGPG